MSLLFGNTHKESDMNKTQQRKQLSEITHQKSRMEPQELRRCGSASRGGDVWPAPVALLITGEGMNFI